LSPEDRIKIGKDSILECSFHFDSATGGVHIGSRTFIGNSSLISIDSITIGDDVLISWGCTIIDNNSHAIAFSDRKNDVLDWSKSTENKGTFKDWTHVKRSPITIKNKAWVGFNSIILKGVTIGEGSIVAAGSVVTKDVPDWTIVGGNPAQIIKHIPENER
jgi:acetyltransferase-like isoleucine patch superfamily enzyme